MRIGEKDDLSHDGDNGDLNLLAGPNLDTAKELARLHKQNGLLRQERELLKKSSFLVCARDREVKFAAILAKRADIPVGRACRVLGGRASDYYAWCNRQPSQRQKTNMVLWAHIRAGFSASRETYSSPHMTAELQAQGIEVGRHRVARLMRDKS